MRNIDLDLSSRDERTNAAFKKIPYEQRTAKYNIALLQCLISTLTIRDKKVL